MMIATGFINDSTGSALNEEIALTILVKNFFNTINSI